jgi:hypothetical protein
VSVVVVVVRGGRGRDGHGRGRRGRGGRRSEGREQRAEKAASSRPLGCLGFLPYLCDKLIVRVQDCLAFQAIFFHHLPVFIQGDHEVVFRIGVRAGVRQVSVVCIDKV